MKDLFMYNTEVFQKKGVGKTEVFEKSKTPKTFFSKTFLVQLDEASRHIQDPIIYNFKFIYSFIHSFTHSFIHSFIYSSIHLFIHSLIPSFIPSFIPLFIHLSPSGVNRRLLLKGLLESQSFLIYLMIFQRDEAQKIYLEPFTFR